MKGWLWANTPPSFPSSATISATRPMIWPVAASTTVQPRTAPGSAGGGCAPDGRRGEEEVEVGGAHRRVRALKGRGAPAAALSAVAPLVDVPIVLSTR